MPFFHIERHPIAILATPKTGNLWIKYVLATVLNFENEQFFEEQAIIDYLENEQTNRRIVFHAHVSYSAKLQAALESHQIKTITLVRNPLDIFLSLRSHVSRLGPDSEVQGQILSNDPVILRDFARTYFLGDLALSAMWAQRDAILVRYEDLITHPLKGFVDFGRKLGVPYEEIGEFAEKCASISDIQELRASAKPGDEGHFTSAEIDKWKRPENHDISSILLDSAAIRTALRLWGYH